MVGTRRDVDRIDAHYWRVNRWLLPCFTTIPVEAGDGPLAAHAWVPVDDRATWVYTFYYHPSRALSDHEQRGARAGTLEPFVELEERTYIPKLNRGNDYMATPAAMEGARHRWAIPGIQTQDLAMTESIGSDYDTGQEHLAASDAAVIQVRRRLVEAVRLVDSNQKPPGVESPASYRVRPHSFVMQAGAVAWPEEIQRAMEGRPDTFVPSGGYASGG